MGEEINKKLDELRQLFIMGSTECTVLVSIHLTSIGWTTSIEERTPESLKEDRITMRNLRGEFIK